MNHDNAKLLRLVVVYIYTEGKSLLETSKRSLETKNTKTSRLLFHPSFSETLAELKKRKIVLPTNATDQEIDFSRYGYPQEGALVSNVEDFGKVKVDAKKGEAMGNSAIICAYDESVNKFEGLQGTAYLTSHSLIYHGLYDFIPVNLLTFYFYTRSSILSQDSKFIKFSEEPEADSNRDYINDREKLLTENVPDNSVIFIDGPLIGGNMADATINLNKILASKGIIPICFVKNSNSNMVTDNIEQLKGKYNSDMHWAYSVLKAGERTNLFRYTDGYNPKLTKIFCYMKPFDVSPQRIEFDLVTYKRYSRTIDDFFDLAYYLLLSQGDLKNPQIRSIAVAEKFARATLRLINFEQMMRDLGITPTMNQERFAW
jgi:hypothetical protein